MTSTSWALGEQFGLSFDGQASPAVALRGQAQSQPDLLPSTWGLAWYPDNQRRAALLKDPDLPQGTPLSGFLEQWGHVRSSLFVGHTYGLNIHGEGSGAQPFMKSYAGRHWIYTSVGDLSPDLKIPLALDEAFFDLVPAGGTPTEHAFSWIVAQIRSSGCRTIDEYGWLRLQELLGRVNEFGPVSFLVSDGVDLIAYRDRKDEVPLYWSRQVPPHPNAVLEGRAFLVDYDGPMDASRTLLVFSTLPMRGTRWTPMEPGELRVARRGAIVWSSHPVGIEEHHYGLLGRPNPRPARGAAAAFQSADQQQLASAQAVVVGPDAALHDGRDLDEAIRPQPESATLTVYHSTTFQYSEPVERSSHRFCLQPVLDERQHVLEHDLEINLDGVSREYEDVFGNRSQLLEVTKPYTEMTIVSRSKLRVAGVVGSQMKSPLRGEQIPLVWMPWQRQMMQAYLMPPELPEPELRELSEFAMSFVERNDYDLVETLLDLNRTIYRDFEYVSGSTTVETTPFEVYVNRKGVCQDFANVLICVARLLSVPARYRVGYIYTGGSYENKIQSDASHAWAEVYLPWTGWFGFDPTNGCLAGSDHVRVACGRQYRDAAPTTGTIYRGGGMETLGVEVRVERVEEFD